MCVRQPLAARGSCAVLESVGHHWRSPRKTWICRLNRTVLPRLIHCRTPCPPIAVSVTASRSTPSDRARREVPLHEQAESSGPALPAVATTSQLSLLAVATTSQRFRALGASSLPCQNTPLAEPRGQHLLASGLSAMSVILAGRPSGWAASRVRPASMVSRCKVPRDPESAHRLASGRSEGGRDSCRAHDRRAGWTCVL